MFADREQIDGVLAGLQKVERADDGQRAPDTGLGGISAWYAVTLDDSAAPVGVIHASKILNRVEEGERVRIWRKPGTDQLTKIRPLDRRLRWWQF